MDEPALREYLYINTLGLLGSFEENKGRGASSPEKFNTAI